MNNAYINLLQRVEAQGAEQGNRTGIDAIRLVCNHAVFDTAYGAEYNLTSCKSVYAKSILAELICFVLGKTNAADFRAMGCNVWNKNANEHGVTPNQWLSNTFRAGEDDLGPIYGAQWREWQDTQLLDVYEPNTQILDHMVNNLGYAIVMSQENFAGKTYVLNRKIDQLKNAIKKLIESPTDRRVIISAWNPAVLEQIALPACHVLQHYLCTKLDEKERLKAVQIDTANDILWLGMDPSGARVMQLDPESVTHEQLDAMSAPKYRLDIVMWQRSADIVLGSPFNIASYDAMLRLMARFTGHASGAVHYLTSDTHIYNNLIDAAQECIERGEHPDNTARLLLNPEIRNVDDLEGKSVEQIFQLIGYKNFGKLESDCPMAV